MVDAQLVEATSHVGRETELADASRLLESSSLVTLAEVTAPDLLASTIGELLGLGDRQARSALEVLVDGLRERRTLLVLDNCEHLVEACAELVATVLSRCPYVVVQATSRQSLGIAGERILPVPPLAIPKQGEPLGAVMQNEAARLFADRAGAVVPSFAIGEDNAADVVTLCQRLDGLPLAIELAAVRLRALSVRQIAERLDVQFAVLTADSRKVGPNRHGTLRALIDWSYELCTEPERLLWARVSVFAALLTWACCWVGSSWWEADRPGAGPAAAANWRFRGRRARRSG